MQDFSPTHPRPDIILMDVQVCNHGDSRAERSLTMSMQMPIRDGYSATHAIRTEAPWKDRPEVRSVPIVAMTASAIQGDKEKCQLAGMDVSWVGMNPFTKMLMIVGLSFEACKGQALGKGKSQPTPRCLLSSDLCQMLVKWAIEGRRKTAKALVSINDNDRHRGAPPVSSAGPSGKDRPQAAGLPVEPETTAHALTKQLDRLHFENEGALARSSESDGDRAMRRIHAEERDTMLRDDKLLSLTGPDPLHRNNHQGSREADAPMPLTEENIEKLVHEQDTTVQRKRSSNGDSNRVNHNQSITTDTLGKGISRPALLTKHRESEQTITKEAPT